MKRKLAGTVIVLFGLVCVMGASTIHWDAGSPVPNPGGKALTIEGKGPYMIDPTETFVRVDFFYGLTGQEKANTNGAKWDKTVTVAAAGKYDCWAELVTTNNNKNILVAKTPVVQALPVK